MIDLLHQIKGCTVCKAHLPLGPRPVISVHSNSRILIVGQAPGTRVHASGIPWDDQSGKRLRMWLNVSDDDFYNPELFGIVPMGFCYPGKGKSGDLPPRKECAPKWHEPLLNEMPNLQLILLIGQYAQRYYLGASNGKNLTETVRQYQTYLPRYFVLPHPSPRNAIWRKKNEWFERTIIPELQATVKTILSA